MLESWEARLARWADAGLLDDDAVSRITVWEATHGASRTLWPALLALAFGGVLVSAGVLLFVAANWDALGPGQRFSIVLVAVAALHVAGALCAERSRALSASLHACGTVALGGGIYLAGQIFNLQEHWPTALLVWGVGAWAGWLLLRQWPQALLAAIVTPAWLVGEWIAASEHRGGEGVATAGVLMLALAYLAAEPGSRATSQLRRMLLWVGGLALIPAALAFLAFVHDSRRYGQDISGSLMAVGWGVAFGLPLLLAWWLRGRAAIANVLAAVWVAAAAWLANVADVLPYVWSGLFSVGLAAWGVIERRRERINLGAAGFALSVLVFYFSSVMDRLGRSASLIGLGLLFLGGGYVLEQARRRLVARVDESRG